MCGGEARGMCGGGLLVGLKVVQFGKPNSLMASHFIVQ